MQKGLSIHSTTELKITQNLNLWNRCNKLREIGGFESTTTRDTLTAETIKPADTRNEAG